MLVGRRDGSETGEVVETWRELRYVSHSLLLKARGPAEGESPGELDSPLE